MMCSHGVFKSVIKKQNHSCKWPSFYNSSLEFTDLQALSQQPKPEASARGFNSFRRKSRANLSKLNDMTEIQHLGVSFFILLCASRAEDQPVFPLVNLLVLFHFQ